MSAAGTFIAIKTGMEVAGKVVGKVRQARDISKTSLAQFTRPLLIESPNFMQESLSEEPVVNDVLKNLYNVYIGYILVALQMDELVVGGRKVRDVLRPVSTAGVLEQMGEFIDTRVLLNGLHGSTEAVHKHLDWEVNPDDVKEAKKLREWEEKRGQEHSDHIYKSAHDEKIKEEERKLKEAKDALSKYESKEEKIREEEERRGQEEHDRRSKLTYDKDTHRSGASGYHYDTKDAMQVPIASGRQVEVKFAALDGGNPISVMLNVQFNTRLIPDQVVEYVISQDFTKSMSDRWLQYKAGEITFVKDFIFGVDKLNRRAKALKSDSNHALADIFHHKSSSAFKRYLSMGVNERSYNLANSILMFDEEFVSRYSKRIGFSFDNPRDRNRFFSNTYALFIVLVDNRYSKATIYTNGIDQSATYSFNELKSSAASDKMSLKDVMDYLSKGQNPKF